MLGVYEVSLCKKYELFLRTTKGQLVYVLNGFIMNLMGLKKKDEDHVVLEDIARQQGQESK